VALVLAATLVLVGLTVITLGSAPAGAQTPAPNPALPKVCGLKFALVFDLSASIGAARLVEMQFAANSVVTELTGTPSAIGVYTFGTWAPAYNNANSGTPAANGPLNAAPVTTVAEATVVQQRINAIVRPTTVSGATNPGYTNWQQGLLQTT
jgi:hypothetical protein